MGKSTISTGPFSIAIYVCLPGRVSVWFFLGSANGPMGDFDHQHPSTLKTCVSCLNDARFKGQLHGHPWVTRVSEKQKLRLLRFKSQHMCDLHLDACWHGCPGKKHGCLGEYISNIFMIATYSLTTTQRGTIFSNSHGTILHVAADSVSELSRKSQSQQQWTQTWFSCRKWAIHMFPKIRD